MKIQSQWMFCNDIDKIRKVIKRLTDIVKLRLSSQLLCLAFKFNNCISEMKLSYCFFWALTGAQEEVISDLCLCVCVRVLYAIEHSEWFLKEFLQHS